MTWMRVASLICPVVAVMSFARGDASQGSAFIALGLVFLVVGEQRSRSSD